MDVPGPIDFWFSIGSTYTYLSVMRIGEVARRNDVAFRWRPFDVRSIMLEMDNIPNYALDATKGNILGDRYKMRRARALRGLTRLVCGGGGEESPAFDSVPITDEMLEAGVLAAAEWDSRFEERDGLVIRVYTAMRAVAEGKSARR